MITETTMASYNLDEFDDFDRPSLQPYILVTIERNVSFDAFLFNIVNLL